ncbi:MAG: hypothetical protein HUU38_12260 [Anaerolineales bacterium]|nr:hypothetical protein [Anaerolineales bacterium]
MQPFSLTKDFKHIQWGSTLWLALLRSLSSTVMWFFIALALQDDAAFSMLAFPVIYFAILLPAGLIASVLNDWGVPFVWFILLMASISIIVGDPLLWVINKIKPGIVPVEEYGFINFKLIIFVLDPIALPPPDSKPW